MHTLRLRSALAFSSISFYPPSQDLFTLSLPHFVLDVYLANTFLPLFQRLLPLRGFPTQFLPHSPLKYIQIQIQAPLVIFSLSSLLASFPLSSVLFIIQFSRSARDQPIWGKTILSLGPTWGSFRSRTVTTTTSCNDEFGDRLKGRVGYTFCSKKESGHQLSRILTKRDTML